jgi:hypothetical protein
MKRPSQAKSDGTAGPRSGTGLVAQYVTQYSDDTLVLPRLDPGVQSGINWDK